MMEIRLVSLLLFALALVAKGQSPNEPVRSLLAAQAQSQHRAEDHLLGLATFSCSIGHEINSLCDFMETNRVTMEEWRPGGGGWVAHEGNRESVSLPKPLLELRPSGGFTLNVTLLPYEKETLFFLLPEGVTATPESQEAQQPREFDWTRKSTQDYSLGEGGWWMFSEENASLKYTSRARVNSTGERMDIELTVLNKTKHPWRFVGFAPCVGPPNSFRDPGLQRTYVLDNNGKLRSVGSLVNHYNYNIISVQGGPAPAARMKPYWRFRNLRLVETLIMTEAKDGRYTLVKAFENASSVITGVTGPCIHSQAMARSVAPSETATIRGFLALVARNAKAGKEYYREWKRTLNTHPGH